MILFRFNSGARLIFLECDSYYNNVRNIVVNKTLNEY